MEVGCFNPLYPEGVQQFGFRLKVLVREEGYLNNRDRNVFGADSSPQANIPAPFYLTGLTPGVMYTFQVRAVSGSTGQSDWSNPVGHLKPVSGLPKRAAPM